MDARQTPSSYTAGSPQEVSSTAEDNSALSRESEENEKLREENRKLRHDLEALRHLTKNQGEEKKNLGKPWLAQFFESSLGHASQDDKYAQLKTDHDELNHRFEWFKVNFDQLSIRNSELECRHKNYKLTLSQLSSKIETQDTKYAELQRAFTAQSKKSDKLYKNWQDTLTELEEAKTSDEQYGVDDDILIAKWKSLCYTIRGTAQQAFKKTVSRTVTVSALPRMFKETSSRCMMYLWKEDRVPLIFGAAIWRYINQCLRLPLRAYDSNAGQAFLKLDMHTTDDKLCKMQNWRSVTGEIFHTIIGVDEKHRLLLIGELLGVLAPSSSMPEEDFHQRMEEIVDKTLELASIFARSRAHYGVWDGPMQDRHGFTVDGFPLDAEWMDECGGDGSGKVVDMVLSPALVKFGNAEGQDYDEHVILAKANIISRL